MPNTLQLVLILLATAVGVVVVFRLLRLPALLGYLLVGIVIGPNGLNWIPKSSETSHLAEFGVVFLMFSIGLEFSLPRLRTMKREVFGFGGAQVLLTLLAVAAAGALLGFDWRAGVVLGGAFAMSSTAILGKMLSERLELNSPHGRQIIGASLFQDLAVIPLLILIPALTRPGEGAVGAALTAALLKAILALALLLLLGQRLMRPWFHLVARQKSSELFMLNVLLITLGLAYVTGLAGLSLALGAFLAGMLISETEYRYQVENDIKPFRDVLLGLFFVTIGMALDWRVALNQGLAVAALAAALVGAKGLLIAALSRLFGSDPAVALRTGVNLAHAGEFGLVVLGLGGSYGLPEPALQQVVLAAMILSMIAAPFLVENSEFLARRFSAAEWMNRALDLTRIAAHTMDADLHVILCGYGRSGQALARFLEQEAIPFIALDLDPQRIKEAAAAGESVVYGDAARREVLVAAGLNRAKALVITYADTPSALRVLAVVRQARPELPVIVRTRDDADIDVLKQAGAAEVVAEIMEGSLMLASHALMLLGVPLNRVLRRIREARESRYSLFRGFFRGLSDEEEPDEGSQLRLHSVLLAPGSAGVGKSLAELDLAGLGAEVTMVRRRGIRVPAPTGETRLEAGDVVVLRGTSEALATAEIRLLQG